MLTTTTSTTTTISTTFKDEQPWLALLIENAAYEEYCLDFAPSIAPAISNPAEAPDVLNRF